MATYAFSTAADWRDSQLDALFKQSVEDYQKKDYERSRKALRRLLRERPKQALYWFNLGNANFMLNDFESAGRCFARVESLRSPLAPAAKLYRAKALAAQGEVIKSRQILQSLLKQENVPPSIRDEAMRDLLSASNNERLDAQEAEALDLYRQGKYRRAFRILRKKRGLNEDGQLLKALILIKLDREDEAHRLLKKIERAGFSGRIQVLAGSLLDRIRDTYSKPKWLFVEAAAGFDSNKYSAPDAESGTDILTEFGAGGRMWAENLWHFSGGYIGRWRETAGEDSLRVFAHELQISFGREVGTDLVLLTPFVQHETWGGDPAFAGAGARLRVRTGNENLEFGLDSELARHSALSDDLSYLSGNVAQGRFYAGTIFYPVYGQAFVDVERQAIGDQRYSSGEVLPMAYHGWGPGLRVLWRPVERWAAQLTVSHKLRDYENASQPGGKKRKDGETELNARLTRIFSQQLSAYVTASYIRHDSNLGDGDVSDESFKQTQILAGALWDAF